MLTKEQMLKVYNDYTVYSVLKLKDKYGFKVKLTFIDGQQEIRQIGGFKTKKEANLERDKVVAQLVNHSYVVYPKIKSSEYFEYWLEIVMKPNLTYNSYMSYRNVVNNYAIPYFKNYYINQINMGHIQKFYNEVSIKYKSIAKLSKVVLNSAFEYAKKNNLINTNPTLNVRLPKGIDTSYNKVQVIDIEKTFNIEQIKLIIEKSKETPIYLHILFALLMGLRKQEINGVKYSDIDYVNRKLYLKRQLGIDPNKSKEACKKKTYTKQEIKLKTFSSERVLDIPDMVFEAIQEQRKIYEANRRRRINDKTTPFTDLGFICCSTYGHPRSKGFHKRYYDKLLEENNLPKIRFHDLRHTYTTLLLMNNHDLKAVSELLGHSSTIITSSTYFDKNKIIVDCNKELNSFIELVKPDENLYSSDTIIDIDTNDILAKYLY